VPSARCRPAGSGHEALLVRKGEVDAALERPEGRVHAREPDDGVEDDIRLRALEEFRQVAADRLQRRVDVVERCGSRGGGAELEFRMSLDDLDRLAADRPRRTEQRDTLHPLSVGRVGRPS
jgi:hypothetical protein